MIGKDREVAHLMNLRIRDRRELTLENPNQRSCVSDTCKDLKFLVVGDGGSFQRRFSYHECVAFLGVGHRVIDLRVD
jgi:hypothetical protein